MSANNPLLSWQKFPWLLWDVLPSSCVAVCLHSSLSDLTSQLIRRVSEQPNHPQNLLREICQHWRLIQNLRGVRIFEPNQNILAFACFRTLSTTCASNSFPLLPQRRFLSQSCLGNSLLEVNSKSCTVLEKTSLILFHLSSTVFDCPVP